MKIKSINIYLLLLLFIAPLICNAQAVLKTLNAEQVLELVRKYHPIVQQSNINIEKNKAELTIAKGGFDPILSNYTTKKTFDGQNYYHYNSPEIIIPTWYGIEVAAGLENLNGNRLDPTESKGKTSYFGVNIPLAKNLLFDTRRADLQKAKIFNTMALVEQKAIINDILYDAMAAYWEWVKAYQTYVVISNNVTVNEKRFELVKKSFLNGERPAIDTTEAVTQLLSFQYLKNEGWFEFQKAGINLNVFLWQQGSLPFSLPVDVIPLAGWENETQIQNYTLELAELQSLANANHPDLKLYNYKLETLKIDRKLKFQSLLPKLDFRYNQLGKGYNLLNTAVEGPLFENNFQYGVKFEMPLRFSNARGNYKKSQLKISETTLDQNQKALSIKLKIENYYNEFTNLKAQINLQSKNYSNYQQLVKAEEIKFFNGESSLFLINSRENKALEALEKLIELKTKYYKSIYALQWSAGLLN